jgi:hypothetical protein
VAGPLVHREQRDKGFLTKQGPQFIGHAQVPMSYWKRGMDGTGRSGGVGSTGVGGARHTSESLPNIATMSAHCTSVQDFAMSTTSGQTLDYPANPNPTRLALTSPLSPITLAPTHLQGKGRLEPNAQTKGGVRCHTRKPS